MGVKLLPGKGAHLHLNGDTLGFFNQALAEVYDLLTEDGTRDLNEMLDNEGAEAVFEELKSTLTEDARGMGQLPWQFVSDKFGDKLFTEMPWKKGTYRFTVVLTDHSKGYGTMKLDIREWYNPNDAD